MSPFSKPLAAHAILKQLTLWLALSMSCLSVGAATSPLVFSRLGTGLDDFPNEGFSCSYQGSFGLMWFGTARGLLRFDGSATRWYRHEPGNPASLPPGNVRVLFEDRHQQFWVGTNGGLARMDRRLGTFVQITTEPHETQLATANNIWSLCEDAAGKLWVGTAAGIYLREGEHLKPLPSDLNAPQEGITGLVFDSKGNLWVATEKSGLFLLTKDGTSFQSVPALTNKKISTLHRGPQGNFWVGTYEEGVFVLSPTGDLKHRFAAQGEAPRRLASDVIRSVVHDTRGHIWIGSEQGLYRYFPENQRLEMIRHIPGQLESLRADDVQHLFVSGQGLLWVATSAAGIDLLNLYQEDIQTHPLDGKGCLAIAKLSSGHILAGTRAGVALFDPQTQTTQWRLPDQTVRAFHVESDGVVYVGTGKGLFLIQPQLEPSADRHVAFEGRIWSMALDSSGRLWLATDTGLVNYNPQNDQLQILPVKPNDAHALNHPVATSLALQNRNYLWIGTFGGGMNRLHLPSGTFEHYQKGEPANSGLLANDVVDVHTDQAGHLWAATLSGGLHRWDPAKQRFQHIPLDSNLHDLTPVAITSDPQNHLWLNTGAGLLQLHPQTLHLRRIRPVDGLKIGSALPGSLYFHHASHELLVGGIEGMSRLSVDTYPEPQSAPLLFTSFKAGQDEIRHLMMPGETIQLSEKQRSFSLQFAVIDYLSIQEQEFAFKRENIDDSWVVSKGTGEANYTNLGGLGGNHLLRIKGSAGNGLWREASFTTQIDPPLWWTWFPLILAMILGCLIGLIYSLVSWREKKKRRALEIKAQLADQRRALAESSAEIAEKEKLLERKERQFQEEHASVVQAFLERRATEIANDLHDGPLGALHGLGFSLNRLSQNVASGPLHETLAEIYDKRLPVICQQLRGLCGDLLTPDFNDGLLAELDHLVDGTESQHPNLKVQRDFATELPPLSQDQKAVIFRIFRILLSNVEKHAQATEIRIAITAGNDYLQLVLEDNGQGFKVPTHWDHFKKQNHYGLYMVAYFARMMGGEFKAQSSKEGSHFTVTLPLQKVA